MVSAAYALHLAAVAALRADVADGSTGTLSDLGVDADRDVTVEAAQGQALPYVIAGGPTDAEEGKTSTSSVSSVTLTLVGYATTFTSALRIAARVGAVLADRAAPLAPSGFSNLGARVDLLGPPRQDPGTEAARPWGCPVRVRYKVSRAE